MKILTTFEYEQEEVLQLVRADLEARGVRWKASTLEFRGALRVSFEVGAEDEETPSRGEAAPASVPALPAERPAAAATAVPRSEMGDILELSQALERSRPGLFQARPGASRELAPNESLEYPREE